MTQLPAQIYRPDWTLQDYIDVADVERENRGLRVHIKDRFCFLNGGRVFAPDKIPPMVGTIIFGDSREICTFEIVRK